MTLDLKIGYAVLANDDCSIKGYSLGDNPDEMLSEIVRHCLSQKEDLCTNRDKYSHSPFHTNTISELCDGKR